MAITYVTVLRYDPKQYAMSFISKKSLVFFNRFFLPIEKKEDTSVTSVSRVNEVNGR